MQCGIFDCSISRSSWNYLEDNKITATITCTSIKLVYIINMFHKLQSEFLKYFLFRSFVPQSMKASMLFPFISDHNSAEHVSAQAEKRDLLNKNISAVSNQLSSMTEERDLLNKNFSAVSNQLSSMTEERDLLTKKTEELKKQSESLCELLCL